MAALIDLLQKEVARSHDRLQAILKPGTLEESYVGQVVDRPVVSDPTPEALKSTLKKFYDQQK